MPMYRDLWENIRKDMPKKGRGQGGELDPLKLPTRLQTAMQALYALQAREYRRARRLARAERKVRRATARLGGADDLRAPLGDAPASPEERIRRFQKKFWSTLLNIVVLFVVNLFTGRYVRVPWFLIPSAVMLVGLGKRIAGMVIDGIPLVRVFQRQPLGVSG